VIEVGVVGAGAVGLTLAGRLAQHGVRVALFEAAAAPERVGSRAICMQRETLEIWARLGVGEAVAARGVQWRIGRTYFRGRELFSVELPGSDEHFPPFVNISQSEVEGLLADRIRDLGVEIHLGHRLIGLEQDTEGVTATFATEGGEVAHRSSVMVGTDGAHSAVRHAIGLGFEGSTFDDRFLIADVRAELPFTAERHFHFDPPWNPGRQVLIHPQPDGIWRIDWQVPSETDADAERDSGALDRRIRAVIGERTPYELVWVTGYRFSQRIADAFRSRRVFLAGDAAHVMSPFGARGLNSGVADAENLAWKLALVERGDALAALLDTYEAERRPAALENLDATEATMRFMAPHGLLRRAWRDLVLRCAPRWAWFRRRVNSGRLAEPAVYSPSTIVAPGHGRVTPDVPLPGAGRLRERLGRGYVVVAPRPVEVAMASVVVGPGTAYGDARAWLVRPDGYLADSRPIERARELADQLEASRMREAGAG
jgi:2-polyprenyl-6-methoxyphenol hydroxylase-like FAD-dependent oxidoreductase